MIKVELEHGVAKCEIGGGDKELAMDIPGLLVVAYNALRCIKDSEVRKEAKDMFMRIARSENAMKGNCGGVYCSGSDKEENEEFEKLSNKLKKLRKRIHELEEEKDND